MSACSRTTREGTVLSLRVTDADLEALDLIRRVLRPLGIELTRHAAARAALRRGLAAMQDASDTGGASD